MGEGTAPQPGDHAAAPLLAAAFPEAAALGARLVDRGMTIAVAESCTGGLLGAVLTATAGSSAYVRGGIIAYADDIKADHLGVGRHLLVTHGAVSAEVAMAMAIGACERFAATIGVGITFNDPLRYALGLSLMQVAIEISLAIAVITVIVAACKRAACSSVSFDVSSSGESFAPCRISSEYALPMPLNNLGSASERLSV